MVYYTKSLAMKMPGIFVWMFLSHFHKALEKLQGLSCKPQVISISPYAIAKLKMVKMGMVPRVKI